MNRHQAEIKGEVAMKAKVVFYCPYDFEVGGAADDVWGYIDCQLGGAGYDEVRTGEQKIGRLECSKSYSKNAAVRFKLYLEYTDWWGAQKLREETKFSNGNIYKLKIFEFQINVVNDYSNNIVD